MLKVVKIMKGNLCYFTTFFVFGKMEHLEQIFNSEKNEKEKTASASAIATIGKKNEGNNDCKIEKNI